MIKNYNQTWPGLEQNIISRVHQLEKRKLRIKQSVYAFVSATSLVGGIFLLKDIINVISTSGAYEYLSLLFYDVSVFSYWKELSLSIVETLPFLSVSIVLGCVGLFLWSMLKTIKIQYVKRALILN